jgi:hypothetical protein
MNDWDDMNTITSFPAPVPTKPWYTSKTIIFNTISTLVGVAGVVPHPAAIAIAGIGNVLLRVFYTEKRISS